MTNIDKPITSSQIVIENHIEVHDISTTDMDSHIEHWEALTSNAEIDVHFWLSDMLNTAVYPLGLHSNESSLPQTHMLINDNAAVHVSQIIALDMQKKPTCLMSAFPCVDSPHHVIASIERIIRCNHSHAAVLRLGLKDNTTIYAFDREYAINAQKYNGQRSYKVMLSGLAYHIEKIVADDNMTVTDPEAIRHHRALNAILEAHDGVAPDNLQEQLAAWQPSTDEETRPITLNMSTMCAYLYGDCLGQEDEAWCQGEILGLQTVELLSQPLYLLDVAILREENSLPVVLRIAAHVQHTAKNLQVGDFIRTNIWLQAQVCGNNMNIRDK